MSYFVGGCSKSLKITFASLHFAKVSCRTARTFGKVDYIRLLVYKILFFFGK